MPIDAATEDFFRLRLDHMIDLRHALAVLSSRMPWQQIETWEHLQARRQLRQDATHSRSPQRTVARQRAGAVAGTDQESQTGQRGDRGASGQNGQNDLGGHCQGTRFPTRLQERQAASGVRRMS